MNRLISRLDGYALVSNSDAHSGANLGREANLFAGRPSYAGMRQICEFCRHSTLATRTRKEQKQISLL